MDSLFEILVVISIIWSVISSFISNKKKQQAANTSKTTSSYVSPEESMEELFSKLTSSLGDNPTKTTPIVEPELKVVNKSFKTESAQSMHEFPVHEKRTFTVHTPKKRINSNSRVFKVKEAGEFSDAIDHEHFDTSIKNHHDLTVRNEIEPNKTDFAIDIERLLSPSELRDTILLSEVLDKPKALRNHR